MHVQINIPSRPKLSLPFGRSGAARPAQAPSNGGPATLSGQELRRIVSEMLD